MIWINSCFTQIMEFSLLHLRYVLIVRCFCVSLKPIDGGIKFVRQNQPETLECPLAKQKVENWQIGLKEISSLHWLPVKTNEIEANVIPGKDNILNITLLSSNDVTLLCKSTDKWIKFQAVPMYNDNGNLYPISGTPYVIKDKKFTLKCNEDGSGTSTTWYTGNGTVIAKYSGASNQNYSKYFGSRQETSCQNKSCTLSITNVSLDEDDMSIICRSSFHISMFNIKVIVLPKSVTIKNISNTVPVENQNKSYECLIKDTNPTFSVFWLITMKDGTPKNATKYISNRPSKSGKLTTLSSKLTLTLNKNFQKLQCVAYFPGKNEFVNYSKELDLHIKYPPERDNMILNVFGGKVCIDTPAKFQCSWEGGNPPASVTLMYKDISYTTKENVELNVEPSESHQTVKCLGTHIVANVSCEKNLTFYYPPQINMHILEEKNATVINCTLFDMNPATNKYILKQKWGNTTKNTYDTNVFIKNPSFNNAGTWECHISNENFCMSKPLNYKIPVRPILSSIASDPKKRSVSNGESVILKQCFYSHPKSDVKWQKNEELIDSNKYLTSGFVSSEFPFKRSCTSLKIEDIKDYDFGTYTLTVENSKGKEIITFALRSKEVTEIPLKTIIGCTVGIVLLLIILGLLAYKCYKIRGVKRNKGNEAGMNPLEAVQQVSVYGSNASLAEDVEGNYETISIKPNTEEKQYTEISEHEYECTKHRDVDVDYVNASRKPDDVDVDYVNASRKPDDVDVDYVNASRKPDNMDIACINISRKPGGYR